MEELKVTMLLPRLCMCVQEGILLNLQVDGNDGDQLVQFRSLVDIWAVRKVCRCDEDTWHSHKRWLALPSADRPLPPLVSWCIDVGGCALALQSSQGPARLWAVRAGQATGEDGRAGGRGGRGAEDTEPRQGRAARLPHHQ